MTDLKLFNERIEKHLSVRLQANCEKSSSLYFGDHGLTNDELIGLFATVKYMLRETPVQSLTWTLTPLPLIVCAVEVGYEYEGNGTDFWPMLESRLEHPFGLDHRVQLSSLFQSACNRWCAVTPGSSEWEQAFCHIAWPITHAVAAKDIRRPFADCLRRFGGKLSDTDSSIASELAETPTTVGSRRFRTWLTCENVVAGIVRDLLGGPNLNECGLFSQSFREKLIEDLRREPAIQRAVRNAKTNQDRKVKKSKKDSKTKVAETELLFGEFFLRQDDHGEFGLFGELPEMPRTVQNSLRIVRRKWQPKPWGFAGATSLPSDTLRSLRGTFPIEMTHVARASDEKPFFEALDCLPDDADCINWLKKVRFHASEKLVFHPLVVGGDTAHAITTQLPQSGTVWVLTKVGHTWPDVQREKIGETLDGEIFAVDVADDDLRTWLGWHDVRPSSPGSLRTTQWLIPAALSISADGRRVFTTDDEIGIRVCGNLPIDLILKCDGVELDRQVVQGSALASLDRPGNYELVTIQEGRSPDVLAFTIIDERGDGFIEPDPEFPWRCKLSHVDSGVLELTRADFFNRRVVLDIEADRTIENVPVHLAIAPGEATVKLVLQSIPARLGANHTVWQNLKEQLPSSVLASACDLTLSVEIAKVTRQEWRLETELQRVWWIDDPSGLPRAMHDRGIFETIHQCVTSGQQIFRIRAGDPFVSHAIDEFGNALIFDSRVSVVGDARLQLQLERPDRFLRQMEDVSNCPGVRSIAKRYIALASASCSSLAAEINRVGAVQTIREWLLTCLCGSNWVGALRQGKNREVENPISVWWRFQQNYPELVLPKLAPQRTLPTSLPDLMLAEFAGLLPDTWWDGQLEEITVNHAASLDLAFKHLFDGEEVFVDAEVLARSLQAANEFLCGSHLAELVVPMTGGDEIMQWHLTEMPTADLSDSLWNWSRTFLERGRGRQSWAREELHVYLKLLLYPEQLRKAAWESVIEKLLHDRPMARAGAFLVWRIEQNARLIAAYDDLLQLSPDVVATEQNATTTIEYGEETESPTCN